MPGRDDYAGLLGRFYSSYIARPRLARTVGKLFWASDFGPLYDSLETLREVRAEVVVDIACGAGLALQWLDPAKVGRYVGIDQSPAMLARAEEVGRRRGFTAAELDLGEVTAIALPDGAADLALLYNGLHCFARPEAAVVEAARCLKPAGQLVGAMLVRGENRRVDRMMEREARKESGVMGPGGTIADLQQWLEDAGFGDVETSTTGSFATFSARR
ncbi:class I SAM-dependent methyltransferase [soil metagenome]